MAGRPTCEGLCLYRGGVRHRVGWLQPHPTSAIPPGLLQSASGRLLPCTRQQVVVETRSVWRGRRTPHAPASASAACTRPTPRCSHSCLRHPPAAEHGGCPAGPRPGRLCTAMGCGVGGGGRQQVNAGRPGHKARSRARAAALALPDNPQRLQCGRTHPRAKPQAEAPAAIRRQVARSATHALRACIVLEWAVRGQETAAAGENVEEPKRGRETGVQQADFPSRPHPPTHLDRFVQCTLAPPTTSARRQPLHAACPSGLCAELEFAQAPVRDLCPVLPTRRPALSRAMRD